MFSMKNDLCMQRCDYVFQLSFRYCALAYENYGKIS